MKKKDKEEKIIREHIHLLVEPIIDSFNVDKEFVLKISDIIEKDHLQMILDNYKIKSLNDNPLLAYNITLSICLNMVFDSDRLDRIEYSDEYINNFVGRVVAQTIYSDLDYNLLHTSPILNHPIVKSILALSSLIKYRSAFDSLVVRKTLNKDLNPIFILLKEAMESLEGTYLLIANKSFSQAMTVFRLYLEQIINVIALIKNPKLIDKYIEFQHLATKYALDTQDKDIEKLIEENKIPPRDIKSYLNYGWIENMKGFDELPKRRYSIKIMAKLCDMEAIYELYSDSTNYVHMNFLLANIDWISVINKMLETSFATIIGIITNYKMFTGFDFVYKGVDLVNETKTILNEFIHVTSYKGDSYDVLRLKNA
ncbi:MAG: hypothetical protein J6Y28_06890 [Acholeplasmatales bacterium]|nr:hypothetical protein [Acholeplasmatales bacterium]